jgi:asparagine synthase (glutamine-hydrolysing)
MCGIAGILNKKEIQQTDNDVLLLQSLQKMAAVLAHRGPDGEGFWLNETSTVGLAHRRLAVIDTSKAAAQPMHYAFFSGEISKQNRYTITYNGEIYNYIELRDELQSYGYRFESKSDTEVLLAAFDCWEEACLQKLDGMFAFVIWDAKKQLLFAGRDRLGEKPFYFYYDDAHFIFASEMKALWAAGVPKIVDDKMLVNYLALGYVQNGNDKEQTFYKDIFALPPAHYLLFDFSQFDYQVHPYWKIDKEQVADITPDQAIDKFNKLFSLSISRRMRADVPLGTSLSGGLDSSAVVAAIFQNQALSKNQKTFSAVFPGFEKDESKYIQSVVNKFKLNNYRITPTAAHLLQHFEKICYHQEEPFQSASILAQYKVYELARQQGVTVVLDGQGADELLAGYPKYVHWYLQQLINRKKFTTAKKERQSFRNNDVDFNWGMGNYLAAYLPAHAAIHLESKAYSSITRQPDIEPQLIRSLRGREWEGIQKPVITKLNDMLFYNTTMLGLEELLRFADRNSMAHGVEVRLPFLQHQLVEFIFSLPANYKLQNGWTKWLLRKAMAKKLPAEVVWRKDKIGYEPPQQQWMADPLMTDYIQESKKVLVKKGILKQTVLHKPVLAMPAHAGANYDWRYLCAARLF